MSELDLLFLEMLFKLNANDAEKVEKEIEKTRNVYKIA